MNIDLNRDTFSRFVDMGNNSDFPALWTEVFKDFHDNLQGVGIERAETFVDKQVFFVMIMWGEWRESEGECKG